MSATEGIVVDGIDASDAKRARVGDPGYPIPTTADGSNGASCPSANTVGTVRNEARYRQISGHSFKRDSSKFNLLIGVTGSVATIKLAELITDLHRRCPEHRLSVRVVSTDSARHFFDETMLNCPVYFDDDEWLLWRDRGDPVLHIELRKWADAMLIAPLDANTLAKIANGTFLSF